MTTTGLAALPELRAQRRKNHLARLDWFEAAYRAYLAAFLGGLALIWIAGRIGDTQVTESELAAVHAHGPAFLGIIAALAIGTGLRSGSRGGPLALEPAEVRHVLLAPIDRRTTLLPSAIKSVRHGLFAGLVAGAAIGVLAAKRLPGNRWAWAGSGALFGSVVMLGMLAGAFFACGLRVKRPLATAIATVLLGGAVADAFGKVAWPTTAIGSLGLWASRVHPVDFVSVVVLAAALLFGLSRLGQLALEHAERRTALVGQMRFAVTMQDLRTVTVLRRQLAAEVARDKPWFGVRKRRSRRRFPIWGRSWHGLLRTPVGRLARMVGLCAILGLLLPQIVKGNGALIFPIGVGAFLVGLDILEPLAQAVDRPDRTDLAPIDRGEFFLRHLPASAVAMLALSAISGAVAYATADTDLHRRLMLTGAPIVLLVGLGGAVISVMMGAPKQNVSNQVMPPEVAGMKIAGRAAWPFIVAMFGTIPLLQARSAEVHGRDVNSTYSRLLLGCVLLLGFIAAWARHRDAAAAWWAKTMKDSQEQAAARKKKTP